MLSDPELNEIEALVWAGVGIKQAIEQVIEQEPTMEMLMWLRANHYQRFTDAKKGEGYSERERALRQQVKGEG
jgi:hypothetical protein